MVLSKSKFSEFEPLPAGADLDNVFLAGYTFDEDGNTYNTKVQASSLTETKSPNIIPEISTECCSGKYKWVKLASNNVCEFNVNDYKNYVEVKSFTPGVKELCTNKIFNIKLPDNLEAGTDVKVFLRRLDPGMIQTIAIYSSDGSKIACVHEGNCLWNCILTLTVTSESAYCTGLKVIDINSEIHYKPEETEEVDVLAPEKL